jgi:hypothetical protein
LYHDDIIPAVPAPSSKPLSELVLAIRIASDGELRSTESSSKLLGGQLTCQRVFAEQSDQARIQSAKVVLLTASGSIAGASLSGISLQITEDTHTMPQSSRTEQELGRTNGAEANGRPLNGTPRAADSVEDREDDQTKENIFLFIPNLIGERNKFTAV